MISFFTDKLLPTVLNMSVTAGVVILFVLAARLFLRKAPKFFSYALWSVVLFRLLCPVSITADFSLLGLLDSSASSVTEHTSAVEHIQQPETIVTIPGVTSPSGTAERPFATPDNGGIVIIPTVPGGSTDTGITVPAPGAETQTPPQSVPEPVEPERNTSFPVARILCLVWLAGIAVMVVCSAISFLNLRRRLVGAVKLRENIYLADRIDTPFVMGIFRAKIYLPSALTEREQKYILLHEQYHIRRMDHIIKMLAFLALCIHWFNPLVWLAFILASKDMEMSCDEAVMSGMDRDIRTEYSASLLSLAAGRRFISGTPLAFGEGDTKSRIKNILNWKKPKVWIILAAAVLCVVSVAFCALNPGDKDTGIPEQTDDTLPDDTQNEDDSLGDDPDKGADGPDEGADEPDDTIPLNCEHPQFKIAFDSQPTRFTVVDWFFDHAFLDECPSCGEYPFDSYASETSFSDCLEGLKSGKYDVVIIPCGSELLSELSGYTVVPIQRDAIMFVRSNSPEKEGFGLTDEQIRRAFTSNETVYWDDAKTDPIIPASGGHDGATVWQHISRLFGFSPTSSNVIFIGQGQDNAPMAIADSGRDGSGLWPYYFSCLSGEAALNGEPIAVNGVYPSTETVADGSYPYTFTYYAVYAPDNAYASEIGEFVSYAQQLKYYLFETIDTLRILPLAWERSFEQGGDEFSIVGINGEKTHDVVINGILLQTLYYLHDQLALPKDPDALQLLPYGIRIELNSTYWRQLSLFPCTEAPCVRILLEGKNSQELSVVCSPQLYLYLTALAEKENATLADPDNDGFFEAFIWQYSENDLVIYDYYDGEIHRISTNETIGCAASNYTGLIANVLPKYNNMIQGQSADGSVKVYSYRDGAFHYVCPMSAALGQEEPEEINTTLTEEELAYFESLFVGRNGMGRTFLQMLLSCEYTTPESIDLAMVFREGIPNELGAWGFAISNAEKVALRAAMGAAYSDNCHKIPRTVMEDLLVEYLGLSLADTKRIGMEQFTYLEQYDAYYICCSTTSRVVPDFGHGIRRADGLIELTYHKKITGSDSSIDTHVLVLRQVGDDYLFVANVRTLRPGMTFESYRAASRGALAVNGLSQSENEQIESILQEFFTLHAASLAGVDLSCSEQIPSDFYHYVRQCAGALRAGYTEAGNNTFSCSAQYELLYSEYDGERLTLSIRETAELYYYPNDFVIPAFTSSNISVDHVLLFTRTQDGGFDLVSHSNDWRYTHYYPASGSVVSITENGGFTADHLDLFPTVYFSKISNGVIYLPNNDSVVVLSLARPPVTIPMKDAQVTIVRNGRELVVDYRWAKYENTLAAHSQSGYYSVTPLPDSNRYLELILDMGYTYLIDTTTGVVLDPLAALDSAITEYLSFINFSPDGQYAVISYHSGTECILLNCRTGEVTQLPYDPDICSVRGYPLDETHIMLISTFEVGAAHKVEYSRSIYDITTGALAELPGLYTAKDSTADNFLCSLESGTLAYTYDENWYLVIVNLTERIPTQFKESSITQIFFCPDALAGVVSNGIVYLLDQEGNAHAVCGVAP